MNMVMKRYAFACAAIILMLLAAPRYAEAIRFEYSASEDGFNCKYRIPFFGFGRVSLTDPSDTPKDIRIRFLFLKLATLQLSIASINPDAKPPSVTVHYELTPGRLLSRFITNPIAGDIPAFFGNAGIRIKFFRKWFLWTPGNDADGRLLLTKKRSKYDLDCTLPQLTGNWTGEANQQDTEIQQEIIYNNIKVADLSFTVTYMPVLITKIAYSLKIINPLDPSDNGTSFGGNLVLPNGSYHVWYNVAP